MSRNSVYFLILAVLILLCLGIVMVTSVGAFVSSNQGDPHFFVSRHLVRMALALGAGIVLSQIDYHRWLPYAWVGLAGTGILMLLCMVPPFRHEVNGAYRWLYAGPLRFQPAEFSRLALMACLAYWLGKNQKRIREFKTGFVVPAAFVGGTALLTLVQKDLGSTGLLLGISGLLMFVAGTRWRYLAPIPVFGACGLALVAYLNPERFSRIDAWLHPEEHMNGAYYQIHQALIAFGSGGVKGMGLGNGVQKMFYVPESHTDFIFAIIGEELGMVFTLTVVFCFLIVALTGGYIAMHAPERSGVLLGLSATSLICIQAGFNMAVVTDLVPAKGIGLPFISYGGSNLILCLMCVGILVNIHRQAIYERREAKRIFQKVTTERM